jgi:hypothetical protein
MLTGVNNLAFIVQVLQGKKQATQDVAKGVGGKPLRRTIMDEVCDAWAKWWVREDQVVPFRPVKLERVQQAPDSLSTRMARPTLLHALIHGDLVSCTISQRLGADQHLEGDMAMLAVLCVSIAPTITRGGFKSLQVTRQPDGRADTPAKLCNHLIPILDHFTDAHWVVTRCKIVRLRLLLNFLVGRDSNEVGVSKCPRLKRCSTAKAGPCP